MSKMTEQTVKQITRNLTGNRQYDIAYLEEAIEEYRDDRHVTKVLKRILSCLTVAEMHPGLMTA